MSRPDSSQQIEESVFKCITEFSKQVPVNILQEVCISEIHNSPLVSVVSARIETECECTQHYSPKARMTVTLFISDGQIFVCKAFQVGLYEFESAALSWSKTG